MPLLLMLTFMTFTNNYNFAQASPLDQTVYGASRPGYGLTSNIQDIDVNTWIEAMSNAGITRVIVLLDDRQMAYYENNLLTQYKSKFIKVDWIPIADFGLPTLQDLRLILKALAAAQDAGDKVVVHCSAGMGRTGLSLAAWLVCRHGIPAAQAVKSIVDFAASQGASRCPTEATGAQELLESLTPQICAELLE